MKPNEKRTQNLYNTLYYSGNVEEEFEQIIENCERTRCKYKDPNFYPQKNLIEEDKELLKDHEWRRLEDQYSTPLFDNVKAESIKQGSLGDCYFVVGLIYASHDIDLVKSLFHPKSSLKHGVVLVYFWFLGERIPVIVDTQIAYYNKSSITPSFSHPRTNEDSGWFVLVEKAYAKACGGYSVIESGKSSFGIHLMFDYFSTIFNPISDIIPIRTLEEAKKEISDKNNKIFDILNDLIKRKAMIGSGTPEEYSHDFPESIGIINMHSYIIIGLNNLKNIPLIKLRNPWGESKYKGSYSIESNDWTDSLKKELNYTDIDDGSFWMPFDDFLRYFVDVNYSLKKELKWKEMSVFGKIEGYLDGRTPCVDTPNVGCIPQWKIKFSQKTVVRISYDFSGPVSFHSIYICENHGYKVNALDVQTKMMRSTSKQAVNGIEYNVENYKEPLTFFFTRTEANEEPCYFRILIQSPDSYFKISKFDDDFIKQKWNCFTETGFFTDDVNDKWDPTSKERPLSTCKQWYVYFPDLRYDDETELRFRVYKKITENSLYLMISRSKKRLNYFIKGSEIHEMYSKSNYEEFSIPINRNHLNYNNDSFHYVFSFYRKELNDVDQFKFSVLSKSRIKYGLISHPDPENNFCYQVKGKLYNDENDGAKPYNGGTLENLKQWCLVFKEPTTLFIEYFNNNTSSDHFIFLQKVNTKGGKIGKFLYNSDHFDFGVCKDCIHDLKDFEIEDHSKPYALCVTRQKINDISEYTLNIYATEEFEMYEINENGLGQKVGKFIKKVEKPVIEFPEVKFVEQPTNFTPKKYNSKLKINTILQQNPKIMPSKYILDAIIEQIKSTKNTEIEMIDIEENHKFDLKYQFPNGKTVTIKDYNKMNFYEIFDSFHKDGYYYSEACFKNNFYLFPDEDKINGEFNEKLEINEINAKLVTLNYDQMHFILSENETGCDAYNLIRKVFNDSELVSILDDQNERLKYLHELKTNEHYTIKVEYQIMFQFVDGSFSTQYMDFLATVSDAKKKLASLFDKEDEKFSPEYIAIYDQHKRKIFDYDMMLKDIQNLSKMFYFEIDVNKMNTDKLNAQKKENQLHSEERKKDDLSPNENEESNQKNFNENEVDIKQKISPIKDDSNDSLSFIDKIKQSNQSQTPKTKSKQLSKEKIPQTEPKLTKNKKRKLLNSPRDESKNKTIQEPPQKEQLEVILVCDNINDKYLSFQYFNPIEKILPIDTKISEIQEMISYEFLIPKNQLIIMYKNKKIKTIIEPDKTIGDVKQHMLEIQNNGICRNYLYYDFGNSFEINSNRKYNNDVINSFKTYKNQSNNPNKFKYYNDDKKYSPKIIKTPNIKNDFKLHMKKEQKLLPTIFNKPTKKAMQISFASLPPEPSPKTKNKTLYFTFIYENKEIDVSFQKDYLLLNTESIIKKMFKIDPNEEIEFFIKNKYGEEEMIEKSKTIMKYLKKTKIRIYLQKLIKKPTIKYHYTINDDETVLEIELDPDATIKSMKKEIANLNNINDLSMIKVIFKDDEVPDRIFLDFFDDDELFLVKIEGKNDSQIIIEEEEED